MPRRKSRDDLERVVRTAARMFAERGFERTTVAAVAREAEVADGTVIYHFKSKNNLLFYMIWELSNGVGEFALRFSREWERPDAVSRLAALLLELVLGERHKCEIAFRHFPEALRNHENPLLSAAFRTLRQSRDRLRDTLFGRADAGFAEDETDAFVASLLGFVWMLLFAGQDEERTRARLERHLAQFRDR